MLENEIRKELKGIYNIPENENPVFVERLVDSCLTLGHEREFLDLLRRIPEETDFFRSLSSDDVEEMISGVERYIDYHKKYKKDAIAQMNFTEENVASFPNIPLIGPNGEKKMLKDMPLEDQKEIIFDFFVGSFNKHRLTRKSIESLAQR